MVSSTVVCPVCVCVCVTSRSCSVRLSAHVSRSVHMQKMMASSRESSRTMVRDVQCTPGFPEGFWINAECELGMVEGASHTSPILSPRSPSLTSYAPFPLSFNPFFLPPSLRFLPSVGHLFLTPPSPLHQIYIYQSSSLCSLSPPSCSNSQDDCVV